MVVFAAAEVEVSGEEQVDNKCCVDIYSSTMADAMQLCVCIGCERVSHSVSKQAERQSPAQAVEPRIPRKLHSR